MSASREQWEEYYSTVIKKGLEAALDEADPDKPLHEYPNIDLKLNKLAYVAMSASGRYEHLQHSWHIYGGDMGDNAPHAGTVTEASLDNQVTTKRPDSTVSPDTTISPSNDEQEEVWTEEDYYEFFQDVQIGSLDGLIEILAADRITLLREFYAEFGEEAGPFSNLYESNVRLQENLDQHEENGVNVDQFGSEDYAEISDVLSELRDELYLHEEFSPTHLGEILLYVDENVADKFREFLEFLDDIYYHLSVSRQEDIPGDISVQFSKINDFYHDFAWKVVTEVISMHTIRGPREEELRKNAKFEVKKKMNIFDIKFGFLEEECRQARLLPDAEEDDDNSTIPDLDDATMEVDESLERLPERQEFREILEQ